MAGDPAAPRAARLVCRCVGISSTRIAAAIAADGLADLAQVGQATSAGTVCGSCHSEIEELLAEHAGRPWPEARVHESRRTCHAASLIRIESVLFQLIAPSLPPGTALDLVSLDGLQLELHLRGGDAPELRRAIEQRLRKLVCAEICVSFS
jgi:bacterioferritin-associated ferredoxin